MQVQLRSSKLGSMVTGIPNVLAKKSCVGIFKPSRPEVADHYSKALMAALHRAEIMIYRRLAMELSRGGGIINTLCTWRCQTLTLQRLVHMPTHPLASKYLHFLIFTRLCHTCLWP